MSEQDFQSETDRTESRRVGSATWADSLRRDPIEAGAVATGPLSEEVVLRIEGLTQEYGQEAAVRDFDLAVKEGELLTLLGPSGCGKTTTLRMIAGLERPSAGEVRIGGETVTGDGGFVPPEDRDVGLVFQNFALFPHLTVEENITFGIDSWDGADREARATELLELVDLEPHREKPPAQLSGGQQQRVALARSLAPEPEVLLLDEPFSNLDVRLRIEMREEVRRILKETGVTAISVTHDQEEALSISDRVAIMNDGRLEQVGKPEVVFENPESRFVASFLGRASFIRGQVYGDTVETVLGSLETSQINGPVSAYEGAEIDVLVRPDDLEAVPANEATANGKIIHRQYNGPTFVYRVELTNGSTVRCLHNHVETFEHGQPVTVSIAADHALAWYPAE
jgi:iron(III) transport system ATP-binding protein